ncbi:MAG: 4'-phosphopantetheinyl transferase family protein [Lachnospiraceae bacterium]
MSVTCHTQVYVMDVRPLGDEEFFHQESGKLSEARKEKLLRLKQPKDRMLSLGAGLLLDAFLKKIGSCEKDMEYGYGEYQKPYWIAYPEVSFSLSHSGDYAVAAFSNRTVGIDIQKKSEYNEALERIAGRCFSKEEYRMITACPDRQEQSNLFYRYWTFRESFGKALGTGLQIPVDMISFAGKECSPGFLSADGAHYQFDEWTMDDGYQLALCQKCETLGEEVPVCHELYMFRPGMEPGRGCTDE